MKKLLLVILLMGFGQSYAQDLVPIPYFQRYWPFLFPPHLEPVVDPNDICVAGEDSLVEIVPTTLERNPKATYCKRSMDIVDTIVIHHSETPSSSTVEDINEFHLNRGTADDPWYMIAYHYAVTAPYKGDKKPESKIFQGRPLDLVGAHAGSDAFETIDEKQKKILEENPTSCGSDGGVFSPNTSMIIDGKKTKANNTSVGVVVIGNYSPFSRSNPNGYPKSKVRNPTPETIDMVARLSCQLQKKNPSITKIRWHNFYKATSCPGNIVKYIQTIRDKAGSYGCKFN